MSFEDKVVIGASSGIGAATAKVFAKAKVVMVGRDTEKLNKVEADIKKTTRTSPLVIKADVSNEVEARGIVDKTLAQFNKVDIVINNAGIGGPTSIFSDEYIKEFDNVMALNIRGVAVITKAAVPYLVKTKGNIVNISSGASYVAYPGRSIYCTSKAALDHWSRCLALEFSQTTLLKRAAQSEEIADLILFLASEKAKSITGSSYAIDCGVGLSSTEVRG